LQPTQVQKLEAQLFGAISPQPVRGWLTVRIIDGQVIRREARPTRDGQNDPPGQQQGTLILATSSELSDVHQQATEVLTTQLTWLIFHLGGLGQGARRPLYSRQNRERAPWWRGATLKSNSDDPFWELPNSVSEFQTIFQQRLQVFYAALARLANSSTNPLQPLTVAPVTRERWREVVDSNCRIVVCNGTTHFKKPYALAILHSQELQVQNRQGRLDYDGNLCGQVLGGVKPSPVWIANFSNYQVITIFGATQKPRRDYLEALRQGTTSENYAQIWPLAQRRL
jgi:CRISPR-associated protein Cmr6